MTILIYILLGAASGGIVYLFLQTHQQIWQSQQREDDPILREAIECLQECCTCHEGGTHRDYMGALICDSCKRKEVLLQSYYRQGGKP